MDPFLLLNVADDADDATIKLAYLKLVKKYSPDHNEEMFNNIRMAYESIATNANRVKFKLFNTNQVTPKQLVAICLAKQNDGFFMTQRLMNKIIFDGVQKSLLIKDIK